MDRVGGFNSRRFRYFNGRGPSAALIRRQPDRGASARENWHAAGTLAPGKYAILERDRISGVDTIVAARVRTETTTSRLNAPAP